MSKLIGKPFRCTPEKFASTIRTNKPHRVRYAVCECDCGTIYVSTLYWVKGTQKTYRPRAKTCHNCSGRNGEESQTAQWELRLRERIIRHQLWYQDRTGTQRCDHCHKRRAEKQSLYPSKRDYEYLCRECNAVYHLRPQPVETTKHSRHFLTRFPNSFTTTDQENPGFENMIRMIEDA